MITTLMRIISILAIMMNVILMVFKATMMMTMMRMTIMKMIIKNNDDGKDGER